MSRVHQFECTQVVPRPLPEVFAFFADAANLEAITPPFLRFHILTPLPIVMERGTVIDYSLSLFGVTFGWRTRITDWQPGVRFVDEQEKGPYRLWRHTHTFEAQGASTVVRDRVEYGVPFGPLGTLAGAAFVRRTIRRIFAHRQQAITRLLPAPVAPADRTGALHE